MSTLREDIDRHTTSDVAGVGPHVHPNDIPEIVAAELSRWHGPISDGHNYELAEAMGERVDRLERGDTTEVDW